MVKFRGKAIFFGSALAATDILSLWLSFCLAYVLRRQALPNILSISQEPLGFAFLAKTNFTLAASLILLIFLFDKLYTQRFAFWEETRYVLKAIVLSFIALMLIIFISRRYESFSRAVIIFTCLFSTVLIPVMRFLIKNIFYSFAALRRKIFILGTNHLGSLVAKEISRNKILGYEIAGFLTEEKEKIGQSIEGYPVIGEISEFETLSKQHQVKEIIVALSGHSRNDLLQLLGHFEEKVESIRIIPTIGDIFSAGVKIEILGDILSLTVPRNLFKPNQLIVKSIFEFVITSMITLVLSPVLLIISLAIKLDSPGPIFYIQKRLGKDKKIFDLIKFRSMYVDGDQKLAVYLEKNPEAKREWETYRKLRGYDPRVTRVGRVIRKYSLDELPQLFNFFKRDLNLVGPRPYMPEELEKMGDKSKTISRVKPGITGLWQVRGRNLLTFNERLILDEFYIRNWSLWLDIVILIKTIKAVITREGAF